MGSRNGKLPISENGGIRNVVTSDGSSSSSTAKLSVEPVEMMSYLRRYVTVAVLSLVNLLNYMDRYTLPG